MDDLKLPSVLFLIWDLKRAIEKNLSLKEGISYFLQRQQKTNRNDLFSTKFSKWWRSGRSSLELDVWGFNAQHRVVLYLIESGLAGQSIYEQLKAIEHEFVESCEADIQEHAAKLPLLMQIPLIFLIFPAICMMLIIPTLCQLRF